MRQTRSFVLLLALGLPLAASAHKAWLLPSATVLGNDSWITVDAAVSNDLFYFNHVPLRLDNLQITGPDGSALQPANPHTGKYRSSFDLQLSQSGTYRLAVVNRGLFASWKENGEPQRWRGNAETFAAEVPAGAEELQVTESSGRIETFVTAGAPSEAALQPTGEGLELRLLTHPNDLFDGETANFQLLAEGKPAAEVEIEVVPGGVRYRNQQDEMRLKSDAEGRFSITWPGAGAYWLEAGVQDDRTTMPQAGSRRLSYVATFEVLPQ